MNNIIKEYCSTVCESISGFANPENLNFWNIHDAMFLFKTARICDVPRWCETAESITDAFLGNLNIDLGKDIRSVTLIAASVHEILANNYSDGDADDVLEAVDQDMIKYVVKEKHDEDVVSFLYSLLYFSIRNNDRHSDPMREAVIEESTRYTLNLCSKVKTEFLYALIRDISCNMQDEIYLYLHALIRLGLNDEYNEKVCRILSEYESVLTSLMPQLCYNKLRYILVLSKIYALTGSDCIRTYIRAISATLKKEEIISELKVKDRRSQEGFLFRWSILQNACNNSLLGEDVILLLNDCYNEKQDAIRESLAELVAKVKEDVKFKRLPHLKEYVRLGNELFQITEGRYYY